MKRQNRATTLILVITFLTITVTPTYSVPVYTPGTLVRSTLSVQMPSKPILDQSINDKYQLKSLMLQKVMRDPGVLYHGPSTASDMFSLLEDKSLEVLFTKSINLAGRSSISEHNITITPAWVNDELYYIYIIQDQKGRIKTTIHSKQEFTSYVDKLTTKWGLKEEDKTNLLEIKHPDTSGVKVVDISDKSVHLALTFLEEIEAKTLKNRLEKLVNAGKVVITKGSVLIKGGIHVFRSENEQARAWTILQQLISSSDKYGVISQINRLSMEEGFKEFYENPDYFSAKSLNGHIGTAVLSLERNLKNLSNEGGIEFHPNAYKQTVDVSGIDINDTKEVLDDITKVINHIRRQELERYNKTAPEGQKLEKKDMFPLKIKVKKLSEGLIPSVLSKEDGTLVINSNFVKVMHILVQRGLKKEDDVNKVGFFGFVGDNPEDPYTSPDLGSFYFSLLYSIILHEMRGHFKVENGVSFLNIDEAWAQGERGDKWLHSNLVAVLFYWIEIVEGGVRKYGFENDVAPFLKQHGHLFRNLDKNIKIEHLPEVLYELRLRFEKHGLLPLKRTQISDTEKTVPSYVDILNTLLSEKKAFSITDIAGKLGFNTEKADMLSLNLSTLVDLGVVEKEYQNGSGNQKRKTMYKAVQIPGAPMNTVKKILDDFQNSHKDVDYNELKANIFGAIEPAWSIALIDALRKGPIANAAEEIGNKYLIFVDTDWIPEEQKSLMGGLIQELDKLERKGVVKIIRKIDADEFGEQVTLAAKDEGVPLKNVIIMAEYCTINDDELLSELMENEKSEDRPFFVAILGQKTKADSYIKLIQMLTLTLRLAFNLNPISNTPGMGITKHNSRFFTLAPSAEPIALEYTKDIYNAQQQIITAA